jgi:rhomboid protease GluP
LTRRPIPWLTIAVLAVTAAVTGAQTFAPDLLPTLRRQPSMIGQGEFWRFGTAWLVHDEGLKQIGINFPMLALAGTLAEWAFERWVWVAAFVLAGLAGEVAGLFWQPVGAGNSVAVLGLVGLVAGWLSHSPGRPAVQRWGMTVSLVILAAWLIFSHDIHGPALAMGLLVGQIAVRLPNGVRRQS